MQLLSIFLNWKTSPKSWLLFFKILSPRLSPSQQHKFLRSITPLKHSRPIFSSASASQEPFPSERNFKMENWFFQSRSDDRTLHTVFRARQEVALLELEIWNCKEGKIFFARASLPLVLFESLKIAICLHSKIIFKCRVEVFSFTNLISSILKRTRILFLKEWTTWALP